MREIILDTETTGLSPAKGHRLVEIGCVEVVNLVPTGRVYHQYINPQRDMPEEAFRVHGLSEAYLADFPTFDKVVLDFLKFIGTDRLVIHNATFDMGFLNYQIRQQGYKKIPMERTLDTVAMARKRLPGARVSLDALCQRYKVDNSNREKHGALLDAELLAEVYLHLCGGPQPGLQLGDHQAQKKQIQRNFQAPREFSIPAAEIVAHKEFVDGQLTDALWKKWL